MVVRWWFDAKNLGSRRPDEIIRIPLDTLESIYNTYKLSGAEALGKGVEN